MISKYFGARTPKTARKISGPAASEKLVESAHLKEDLEKDLPLKNSKPAMEKKNESTKAVCASGAKGKLAGSESADDSKDSYNSKCKEMLVLEYASPVSSCTVCS